MADALSRRTVLRGMAASAVATGTAAMSGVSATAASTKPSDWAAFDAAVGAAFDQLNNVGGAVAVVSADAVLHTKTFGVRRLTGRKPVTPDTHFLVASTTKSMTAELVATYVDQGVLSWDQRVVTAYPQFRAPTPALTESLRVRDLLGMATGIEAPPALDFHQGEPTAGQLLQSVVNLPVAHPPGTSFFYNNTVYAVGGYLPLLATGVAPRDLTAAYTNAMRDRIWRPSGMAGTVGADDPRGRGRRLRHRLRPRPAGATRRAALRSRRQLRARRWGAEHGDRHGGLRAAAAAPRPLGDRRPGGFRGQPRRVLEAAHHAKHPGSARDGAVRLGLERHRLPRRDAPGDALRRHRRLQLLHRLPTPARPRGRRPDEHEPHPDRAAVVRSGAQPPRHPPARAGPLRRLEPAGAGRHRHDRRWLELGAQTRKVDPRPSTRISATTKRVGR